MRQAELAVWMHGALTGTWTQSCQGKSFFEYEPSWAISTQASPLSMSLPIPPAGGALQGAAVDHYFDNLLPDSPRMRERLQKRFKTENTSAHALLAAIGRECVGAVQILAPGEKPEAADLKRHSSSRLSDQDVAAILNAAGTDAAPGRDDSNDHVRVALPGAQEKTALLRRGDDWYRPCDAMPSTHILKLPLGLIGGHTAMAGLQSVENEWFCAALLKALGFSVADATMASCRNHKVLVVERFDRQWTAGRQQLLRLPQEDFCQVFGLPGTKKYESDGGPGIAAILGVLDRSESRQTDKQNFLLAQFVFWLLAAADGHAKNFSIAIGEGGRFRLTSLYDVISFWPVIGDGAGMISRKKVKMAMAVRAKNAHYRIMEIQTRHWKELAIKSGMPDAFDAMVDLSRRFDQVCDSVVSMLPADFPAALWHAIQAGTRRQLSAFSAGLLAPMRF